MHTCMNSNFGATVTELLFLFGQVFCFTIWFLKNFDNGFKNMTQCYLFWTLLLASVYSMWKGGRFAET